VQEPVCQEDPSGGAAAGSEDEDPWDLLGPVLGHVDDEDVEDEDVDHVGDENGDLAKNMKVEACEDSPAPMESPEVDASAVVDKEMGGGEAELAQLKEEWELGELLKKRKEELAQVTATSNSQEG